MCVNLHTPNILVFYTEIIVICGWVYWIYAQGINIHMFESWSVQYLETKIM
jgi:hypothetical protein